MEEFESEFERAIKIDEDFITEYEKIYQINHKWVEKSREKSQEQSKDIKPNSMQVEALKSLENLRLNGCDRALLISATGTGKTFLAAFDVKKLKPRKVLFLVHRERIAKQARDSFRAVLGGPKEEFGVFIGQKRETSAKHLFSTIQTISREDNLYTFDPKHFDYIIIDETHRSGASSYIKILDHFKPKFLLGMTATPERTDGFDVFEQFNYNIAYEIRLHQALENDILAPFHYYGVKDLTVNGEVVTDYKDFRFLENAERANHVLNYSKLYGTDTGKISGLGFCSRNEESEFFAKAFKERGLKAISLSGNDPEHVRKDAIEKLESNELDYIFTVDIFNEGIDIPKVNQILMIRPTQSAIVFVQQLGRGLRKTPGKDYLTVIDFIGNHANNYMIPIALYGDRSCDKDNLRKLISSGSRNLPGNSTINFDKITQKEIFDSIDRARLNRVAELKGDYQLLKFRLGRIPTMADFFFNKQRNPYSYVQQFKSYYNFLTLHETDFVAQLSEEEGKLLESFSVEILNGKTFGEAVFLDLLLKEEEVTFSKFEQKVFETYEIKVTENNYQAILNVIDLKFHTERKGGSMKKISEKFGFEILEQKGQAIVAGRTLISALSNVQFKSFFSDLIKVSNKVFEEKFSGDKFINGFILYEKYNRKDVFRILGWDQNPVAQNVGGYLASKDLKDCAIFVTYEKSEDITETTLYEDEFINPSKFRWFSKSKRKITSPDVQKILNAKQNNMRLPLFVKKSDSEGKDFYYLGELSVNEDLVTNETMADGVTSVVKFEFGIIPEVEDRLYAYLTDTL